MPGREERAGTGIPFLEFGEKRYVRERRKSRNGHTLLKKKQEKVCPGEAKSENGHTFLRKKREKVCP